MWFTYILYSPTLNKYYTGVTDNLDWRIERHNLGWGRFTSKGMPWELKYYESYSAKTEALRREREIKDKKSKRYIEELITSK